MSQYSDVCCLSVVIVNPRTSFGVATECMCASLLDALLKARKLTATQNLSVNKPSIFNRVDWFSRPVVQLGTRST